MEEGKTPVERIRYSMYCINGVLLSHQLKENEKMLLIRRYAEDIQNEAKGF